jgi:hypothetical protein
MNSWLFTYLVLAFLLAFLLPGNRTTPKRLTFFDTYMHVAFSPWPYAWTYPSRRTASRQQPP